MGNFLYVYGLPKLNEENFISHLTISTVSNEVEAIIKNLPVKKNPGPDGFTAELYQASKEELTPMLLKLFHEIEREGTHSMNQYHPGTKTGQGHNKRKKLESDFLTKHDVKILNKILAN
jgi:hypothetical protein